MAYIIVEPCIGTKDTACVKVCPVDCIHPTSEEGEFDAAEQLYIDPDTCIDCGVCEPECPVTAIFSDEELPGEWKQFAAVNAEWFSDAVTGLGSPGGAAQAGPQDKDHKVVAEWPAVA